MMFALSEWVPCSSEFLFSSMFAGTFFYLANNFRITADAIGSLFFRGSPEVREKINFPNMFASVYVVLCELTLIFRIVPDILAQVEDRVLLQIVAL